jgi:hypothetical protein
MIWSSRFLIPVRCWLFCFAFWLNPPFNIILRRPTFLSIGAVGVGWGSGRHWRKQTEAHEFHIMPVYSLQAQQLVLGHALDDVQVKVLQAHQIVVVVIVCSAERTCGDSLLIDPTHHHCLVSSLHTQQMPKEASANDHRAMHLVLHSGRKFLADVSRVYNRCSLEM